MRLAEAIIALGETPALRPAWPSRPRVGQALDRLAHGQSESAPLGIDMAEMTRAILDATRSGSALEPRMLRMAPWCLWGEGGIAHETGILDDVLSQILTARGSRPLRNLASAYIQRGGNETPGVDEVSRTLSVAAAGVSGIGSPWDHLHDAFDIFDPSQAPSSIAETAIRDGMSVEEILMRAGLRDADPRMPLASRAIERGLEICQASVASDHAQRLAVVAKLAIQGRALKTQGSAPFVAKALIDPFGDDVPDVVTIENYRRLLLDLFGDPRLPSHRWQRMPDQAAAFRRWMTRENLRQFLDVTSTVAKHMFRYREKFWWAVYEAGLIQESWVVFAKKGAAVAKASYGESLPFATFRRSYDQFQPNHAVLLLRMGDCTIAEWSHDGRVTIWSHQDTRGCPRLYEQSYSAGELRTMATNDPRTRAEIFGTVHTLPERHIWQDAVAARIEYLTSVRLAPSSYKV